MYFLNQFDGFIAFPIIRGENARPGWHGEGCKLNKQNSFDDFKEAAKFLVQQLKYTKHEMITIHGTSHGGLVVAACINQAPELFRCAISEVGVMDMVRFHTYPLGHTFTEEFGSPVNQTELECILKYSPLHNIKEPTSNKNQYPSTLIIAASNDERSTPCHSLKFAAELQHTLQGNQFQTNPVLLRLYEGVGHGHGTVSQQIEENTDELTFLHKTLI